MSYQVGDLVFWTLSTAGGEAVFIDHLKANKSGRVLILATNAEIGFEIDAEDCRRTGLSYMNSGREYRQRYANGGGSWQSAGDGHRAVGVAEKPEVKGRSNNGAMVLRARRINSRPFP